MVQASTEEDETLTKYEWHWIGILLIPGWALGMAIGQLWKMCMSHLSDVSLGVKTEVEKEGEHDKAKWDEYSKKMQLELDGVKTLPQGGERRGGTLPNVQHPRVRENGVGR